MPQIYPERGLNRGMSSIYGERLNSYMMHVSQNIVDSYVHKWMEAEDPGIYFIGWGDPRVGVVCSALIPRAA